MKQDKLLFHLTQEDRAKLEMLAKATDRSMASVVRTLVRLAEPNMLTLQLPDVETRQPERATTP